MLLRAAIFGEHSQCFVDAGGLLLLQARELRSHTALATRSGVLVHGACRCDLVERTSGLAHFLLRCDWIARDDGLEEFASVVLHTTLAPQVARVALGGLFDTLLR